jgi:hypothetical protein
MSHKYATEAETRADVLSEVKDDDTEAIASIDRLLEATSAFIDQYCKRPNAYFVPVTPTTPAVVADPDADPPVEASPAIYTGTLRRYRGTGSNFLQVGRFVPGTATVQNIAAELFYENQDRGSFLMATDNAGVAGSGYADDDLSNYSVSGRLFAQGSLYLVTAAWGFEATPPDIVMATKQIVQQIWDRGKGIIGQISPTGFVIERDIPLTAKTFLDGWIKREFELN